MSGDFKYRFCKLDLKLVRVGVSLKINGNSFHIFTADGMNELENNSVLLITVSKLLAFLKL
jgi:hypothetical protein